MINDKRAELRRILLWSNLRSTDPHLELFLLCTVPDYSLPAFHRTTEANGNQVLYTFRTRNEDLFTAMDFLKSALDAIPAAASSPLALAAYVSVIFAWLLISIRVRRNRNLLKNLDRLPEQDRLSALQLEMGHVPMRAGLSPAQYLRSQIHKYYFFGFVIICFLIFLIFAISASHLHGTAAADPVNHETEAVDSVNPHPNPDARVEGNVESIDLEEQKAFVEEKLGKPQTISKGRRSEIACYQFSRFGVVAAYERDSLVFYSIVNFNEDSADSPYPPFRPTLKIYSEFLRGLSFQLGESSFDLLPSVPEEVYVSVGATGRMRYIESFENGYVDYFFEYDGYQGAFKVEKPYEDPLVRLEELKGRTGKLSKAELASLIEWRRVATPNVFSTGKHQRHTSGELSTCLDFYLRNGGQGIFY